MAVRLIDVARRAGVSVSTVSRVLSNKPDAAIPPVTVDRIKRLAKELHYVPNASARALVSRKTHTIGLYTPNRLELSDPHFGQMLVAVEEKARSLGYFVVLATELDGLVEQARVDGILALDYPSESYPEVPFRDKGIVFAYNAEQAKQNCVTWSDSEGGARAGQYLTSLGHRHVAVFYGDDQETDGINRTPKGIGFEQAIREANATCRAFTRRLSRDEIENGYLMTQALLQDRQGITAIFARHDLTAMGVLKALREAGLSIPRDLSVISYFDTVLAYAADPALTSVRTPIAEAGEVALEQLVKIIEGEHEAFPGVMLPTSLTIRASCAPPL